MPDIVSFWSVTVDSYYDTDKQENIAPHHKYFEGTLIEFAQNHSFFKSVWGCLVKRDLLLQNGLQFEKQSIGEDCIFWMRLFEAVPKARLLATTLNIYRYVVHEESVINSFNTKRSKYAIDALISSFEKIYQMRNVSVYPKERYDEQIKGFQRVVFVRLVTTRLSLPYIKEAIKKAYEVGFYPPVSAKSKLEKNIVFFTKHPVLMWLISMPLSLLFPLVKPFVPRN